MLVILIEGCGVVRVRRGDDSLGYRVGGVGTVLVLHCPFDRRISKLSEVDLRKSS